MRSLRELRQWIRRRQAHERSFCNLQRVTHSPEASVLSNSRAPPVNMLLQLPAPLLAQLDSYLGCLDKFNLRLTCKGMEEALMEFHDPSYACHFVPTRMLKYACVFRYGMQPSHANPLVLNPATICNIPYTLDRLSLAHACAQCRHDIPERATLLPTLLRQPERNHHPHPSPHDHKCFYEQMTLAGKVPHAASPEETGVVLDAPIVVEIFQIFSETDARKYTGLMCDTDCANRFAKETFENHTETIIIVMTRILSTHFLTSLNRVVRSSKTVYLDHSAEMTARFYSAGNLLKPNGLRFRYIRPNAPTQSLIFSESFETMELLPPPTLQNLSVASQYFRAVAMQRERTAARMHLQSPFGDLVSDLYVPHREPPSAWLYEAMSAYDFMDDPPIPFLTNIEVVDETGELAPLNVHLTYEYEATVSFQDKDDEWRLRARVMDRGGDLNENFRLMRNLRFNIDVQWDSTCVRHCYITLDTGAAGLYFRLGSIYADELFDWDAEFEDEDDSDAEMPLIPMPV